MQLAQQFAVSEANKLTIQRWVELFALFIALPLCLLLFADYANLLLFPLLVLMALACSWLLYRDAKFNNRKFGWKPKATKRLRTMFLCFAVIAIATAVITLYLAPDALFYIVNDDLSAWLILLIVYPLFSALPQEIIFRTFLFHRYKLILPKKRHRIWVSSFCFGFAHIFYANWFVVGSTMVAGYIFCLTYTKTKSTLLVALEHSLWGLWLFSVGLGVLYDSAHI